MLSILVDYFEWNEAFEKGAVEHHLASNRSLWHNVRSAENVIDFNLLLMFAKRGVCDLVCDIITIEKGNCNPTIDRGVGILE